MKTLMKALLVVNYVLLLTCTHLSKAQKTFFGSTKPEWEYSNAFAVLKADDKVSGSDLVIIEEKTEFYFFSRKKEKVKKRLLVKINTEKGVAEFENFRLPESFDYAWDACYYKQGRNARIKTPFIYDFKVISMAARKFADDGWNEVILDYRYESEKRVSRSGVFLKDETIKFMFKDLKPGDVIDLLYEVEFDSDYGGNIFYFHSKYPKLVCEYNFIYKVNAYLADYSYILPLYLNDTIKRSIAPADEPEYLIYTDKIQLTDLKPINYPANSAEGLKLPHLFLDFNFYRILTGSYSTDAGKVYESKYFRSRNFKWLKIRDTSNYYTKIYDKQFATLRKFVATLPPIGKDSAHKDFFKALCDTFNSYKFCTLNHFYYNDPHLYDVSSGDHLLKRRLVENHLWKLYRDILNDNNIFYYKVNVQDRRYGEHSIYYRGHYSYEGELIAVPSGDSYLYFMPRYSGLKYHLNELPFYFEGVLAALDPYNFQTDMKEEKDVFRKFIKTHKGTCNENTRTENATVKVSLDSLKAGFTIKESLSEQYSTVLRHLYLKDPIDSTIDAYYFKKCTDKPGAKDIKIKLSSKITDFPFRYTFNCSENVSLQNNKYLDLKNWFSFLLSSSSLPEKPSHDYYIDFDFSDAYNFLLDFGSPVEITNIAAFSKSINNDFFELESQVVKNSDSSYLLKVKVVVKERRISEDKLDLLMEMVKSLDEINNFSLALDRK